MGFYEQIGNYYDLIFPTDENQLSFIRKTVGAAPKKILDVACGSGGYSTALAKSGYSVAAIDLDDRMVEIAREKATQGNLDMDVSKCDMKEIAWVFKQQFDCIFCIGNSIVHLGSMEDIRDVLAQMRSRLVNGGVVILQIINYDRIIRFGIGGLPAIKNEDAGFEFTRKYVYDETKNLMHFNTVFSVNSTAGKKTYENSIELLPVRSADMFEMLGDAGFKNIEAYGDFILSPFDENSYMLVVKGTR